MFKIEITTMHEFLLFVSMIRTDNDKIINLTKQLNKSSDELKSAVDESNKEA